MKRSVLFLAVALIASWALLGNVTFAGIGQIELPTITIDDRTDTIIMGGIATAVVPEGPSGGMVSLQFGFNQDISAGGAFGTFNYNIYEPEADFDSVDLVLSDTLQIVLNPSGGDFNTAASVVFHSDGTDENAVLTPLGSPFTSIFETGGFQSIPGLPINVSFASDANEAAPVPEPATFLLLGAGLAGVGLLRRRFRK